MACLEADLGPQHMGYGARVLPFCKEAAQDAWLRLRLESGVRGDRPGKQATEQVFVRQRGKEGIEFALRRLQGA